MKVTVCFGDVRILVPCGSGDLYVKDLIIEATRRYKKASGKEPDAWVAVHHLQSQSGILDPDDLVRDVADDREQILASFEDSGPDPGVPQGGGDGASGSSSVGTGSPDIFRDPTNTEAPITSDMAMPHIEVTSTTSCPAVTGIGLQVRRSSDPNILASLKVEGSNKRWSAAAPHCAGDSPERILMDKAGGHLSPQWEEDDDSQQQSQQQYHEEQQQQRPQQQAAQHNTGALAGQQHQPFTRSGRLSMQFLGDGTGYKWMEAAEKLQHQQHQQHQQQQQVQQVHQQHQQYQQQQYQQNQQHYGQHHGHAAHYQIYSSKSLPRESKRKEPLGQAYESIREKDGEMLLIINEYGSPLGLTAIPDNEHGGGLLVQNVEAGSRAERGRLRLGDRILEINGIKLIGLTEGKVQEYLRRSLESSELRVRVLRADHHNQKKNNGCGGKTRRRDSKVAEMIEAEEKLVSGIKSKVATVSPTRKPHVTPVGTSLQVANTRKLGRKIEIKLKKGPNGLGFSVTTRDNPAGGHCPIYIKNILPRGAAIEDGRLKHGDRLLEVDGLPMTGKTQTDVVSILRATKPGATVRLVVSRQHEAEDRPINVEEILPSKQPAGITGLSNVQSPQRPDMGSTAGGIDHIQNSNSARSLFEQHQQQLQQQLNESQHFIDAGSESAGSSDSFSNGVSGRSCEVLTLHIPVHDTEKAGLGVSVKGKTNSNTNNLSSSSNGSMKHDGDLGIFVKSVIHGGAASRDGRLRMNDQLLSVNGVSLLRQNNAEAMETLRRVMLNNPGRHPGMITLKVARKISRSVSSGDILEQTNSSSNTSENSGATVIYLNPKKKKNQHNTGCTINDMNRWSNPVLERLTGGVCSSSNSVQHHQQQQQQQQKQQPQTQTRRVSRDQLMPGGSVPGVALRNESYYKATNDTWSPASHNRPMLNGHGHGNNSVLIEDDPEPMSPTLPARNNDVSMQSTQSNNSVSSAAGTSSAIGFDATYSSQLSLENNNSGVEHFSRDALGRRSISEKHNAALDARETGTYQRNKKIREERERERRIQLTKSAVFSGSVESLTVHNIVNANGQIPGYKHGKTASSIEQQQQQQLQLQLEARDQVGDLGPSLGLKKSSSLESLQTMVQEIQMSDETRGPSALRAPRGRGREDSLRAAVVSEYDASKPHKTWLLEEGDAEGGFASQRNGPFQSSLNDGKHKGRAKKPSILRGIGHMFRFGKNRKDGIVSNEGSHAYVSSGVANALMVTGTANNQIPTAALAALDRNTKLNPPAYQPPPPLPPANATGNGGAVGNSSVATISASNGGSTGIHQNDIFNHRYQHYGNYEDQHQHQISRRHQHYHSQRSARSHDINMRSHSGANMHGSSGIGGGSTSSTYPISSCYYEYETLQQRMGSLKLNGSVGGRNSPTIANGQQQQQQQQQQAQSPSQMQQEHWKVAAMNGFSPASLNSSARSRGPFVTHVTIRDQSATQATYQTVQKQHQQQLQHQNQQHQQSPVYATSAGNVIGTQPHASKV